MRIKCQMTVSGLPLVYFKSPFMQFSIFLLEDQYSRNICKKIVEIHKIQNVPQFKRISHKMQKEWMLSSEFK